MLRYVYFLVFCAFFLVEASNLAQAQRGDGSEHTIMVWTELSQGEVERCLPSGAHLKTSGRNGYEVSGLRLEPTFVVKLTNASHAKNLPIPRFSRVGTSDPGGPTPKQQEFAVNFAELLMTLVHGDIALGDDFPFPKGVLMNPNVLRARLNQMGQGPKGPFLGPGGGNKKGKWKWVCEPEEQCDRPADPTLLEVDDCKDEQAEIDRLLGRIASLEAYIQGGTNALNLLEIKETMNDVTDGVILVFTVYAILTIPAGAPVGIVTVIILSGVTAKVTKDLAKGIIIDGIIDWAGYSKEDIKAAIAEAERRIPLYASGLRDAYRERRECQEAAAEVEEQNSKIFEDFINKTLPAYYDCLKKRRCYFKWVATE